MPAVAGLGSSSSLTAAAQPSGQQFEGLSTEMDQPIDDYNLPAISNVMPAKPTLPGLPPAAAVALKTASWVPAAGTVVKETGNHATASRNSHGSVQQPGGKPGRMLQQMRGQKRFEFQQVYKLRVGQQQ
jgi:hypothetical protein